MAAGSGTCPRLLSRLPRGDAIVCPPGLLSLPQGAQAPLPPPARPRAHLPPGALAAAAAAASPGCRQPTWPFHVPQALEGLREQRLWREHPQSRQGDGGISPISSSSCSSFQCHGAPATYSIPPKHLHLAGRLGEVGPSVPGARTPPAFTPAAPDLRCRQPSSSSAAAASPPRLYRELLRDLPPQHTLSHPHSSSLLSSRPVPALGHGPPCISSPWGWGARVPFAIPCHAKEGQGRGAASCACVKGPTSTGRCPRGRSETPGLSLKEELIPLFCQAVSG